MSHIKKRKPFATVRNTTFWRKPISRTAENGGLNRASEKRALLTEVNVNLNKLIVKKKHFRYFQRRTLLKVFLTSLTTGLFIGTAVRGAADCYAVFYLRRYRNAGQLLSSSLHFLSVYTYTFL